MKSILKNLTIFYLIGIVSILIDLYFSISLINGGSAQSGLMGYYILLGLIPIILVLIIDRIIVWKFGSKKTNKTQLYILGTLVFLFLINWIRLQLQK